MQIYVDMDGVLADFDQHHEDVFGERACKVKENVDWDKVRAIPNFYANIPPMKDMRELWRGVNGYCIWYKLSEPKVLTGIPRSVTEAESNKRSWIEKHLGAGTPVICCPSKDKSFYCNPGDVLIDDWTKYQHLWEAKGGHFIIHLSAVESLQELELFLKEKLR